MKLSQRRCENCRFWAPSNEYLGKCRRYPPTPTWRNELIDSYTPDVTHDWWCGEWLEATVQQMGERRKNA